MVDTGSGRASGQCAVLGLIVEGFLRHTAGTPDACCHGDA